MNAVRSLGALVLFVLLPAGARAEEQAPAMSAVEMTESGRSLAVPASGIASVDVNSAIRLTMNTEAIAAETHHAAGISGVEADKAKAALAVASEALDKQIHMLQVFDRLLRNPATATPRELKVLGAAEQDAVEAVIEVARSRGDNASDIYATPGARAPEAYLRAAVLAAESQVGALRSRLAAVRFRVRASVVPSGRGRTSVPIHVPGYDSLAEGNISVKDKLVPPPAELAAALETQRALAEQKMTLNQLGDRIRTAVSERVASLRTHLEALVATADFGKLAELLKKHDGARTAAAALNDLHSAFALVRTECAPVLESVRSLGPAPAADRVIVAVARAVPCAAAVRGAVDRSRQQVAILNAARPELLALLSDTSRAQLDRLTSVLESADVVSGTLELLAEGDSIVPTAEWAPAEKYADRELGEIADTQIELVRTSREEGDHIFVQGMLVHAVDGTTLREFAGFRFRIVTAGASVTVSPAAIVVRSFRQASNQDRFRPAGAAVAALHFQMWRKDGDAHPKRGRALWNALNPGIGVHLATLSLGEVEDDGTAKGSGIELGVGATLQLVGDLLQIGAGWDFQADRGYWYLGLGLHTLTRLGIEIPTSPAD
jgi:hypothetical protein